MEEGLEWEELLLSDCLLSVFICVHLWLNLLPSGGSPMPLSPLAGKPVPPELLIDVARLERLYYEGRPDPAKAAQLVSFGTSGHRGSPLDGTFTEAHILAITQAICDYRRMKGIDGPLFLGKD